MIISSNRCHQWSIEYSVESVDIMRSQTLSQGYGKYIKCALCTLYLALSRSISLCAIFVPYLCTRTSPQPLSHSKIITAHPLTLSPLPTHHTHMSSVVSSFLRQVNRFSVVLSHLAFMNLTLL